MDLAFNIFFMIYFFIRVSSSFLCSMSVMLALFDELKQSCMTMFALANGSMLSK